ncbi:SGNH/GDSL hydrolase family protein [Klenkia sp. LSe6-5]|uniref:SGNH/GDSL hydrolase family protein n=1 Tax=Klenkia sesuvii TaxID=3103137 RepID=A0ABU8DYN5_9ACTN
MGLLDPPALSPRAGRGLVGGRRSDGRRDIFFIGSSSTNRDSYESYTGATRVAFGYFEGLSWPGWAQIESNGRWRFAGLAAQSGYSAAQVRDEFLPVALAAAPWACVVHCGQNGIEDLPGTISALTDIFTALLNAGIIPILVTSQPLDNQADTTRVPKLNVWLRRQARRLGVPLIDSHALFTNPATGQWLTAYSDGDQVHSNTAGAQALGQLFNTVMDNWLPPTPLAQLNTFQPDTSLLMSKPLMLNASGSFVEGWSGTLGSNAVVSQDTVAGCDGKMLTVSYTAAGGTTTVVGSTVTLVPGNRYRLGFKHKLARPGVGRAMFRLAQNPAGTEVRQFGWRVELPFGLSTYYQEWVQPAGLSAYAFRPVITLDNSPAAGFAYSIGQFTWENLTANGDA